MTHRDMMEREDEETHSPVIDSGGVNKDVNISTVEMEIIKKRTSRNQIIPSSKSTRDQMSIMPILIVIIGVLFACVAFGGMLYFTKRKNDVKQMEMAIKRSVTASEQQQTH